MDIDLLNVDPVAEEKLHKLKRLVQSPNSYFMDVKCPQCLTINTVFSHAQSAVACQGCGFALCAPTGGKCKLSLGTAWRRKGE
ncbi:hypothetical protein FGO68_gene440 [Halteria grandinella]|uniref:40S ribosomal protein S27 n=1 Tax=Halteria grandinella TaxID=5974 RepID=A0A8J8P4F2_HALGN|nr:hypothetical protein FGO68_gene440 [Halteria grandinella]